MIDNPALQLALTGIFAAAAVYHLAPAVAANAATERVDAAWHALAAVAMVVMLWPWGMAVPPLAGAAVFTGAAGWFAVKAVYGSGRRWGHWYHVVMMASMIAMWVVMARMPKPMPMAMGETGMSHHHAVAPPSPSWPAHTTLAMGVAYLLAAGFLAVLVWRTRDAKRWGAGTLMAAGMGAFFLAAV